MAITIFSFLKKYLHLQLLCLGDQSYVIEIHCSSSSRDTGSYVRALGEKRKRHLSEIYFHAAMPCFITVLPILQLLDFLWHFLASLLR